MRRIPSRLFLLPALLLAFAPFADAGQPLVSTMKNVSAVMQSRGFYIAPAGTGAIQRPGDLAPVQSFEIVRPNGEKITIGRIHTSCTCVRLEAPKRSFERGERAVVDLHNVLATPPSGQRYAIYVQITSPIKVTLRYDTFVQSSQFITQAPVIVESSPVTTVAAVSPADTERKDETPKAVRVKYDDDLDPVITIIEDPHAEPEEKGHDKYSQVEDVAEDKKDAPQADAEAESPATIEEAAPEEAVVVAEETVVIVLEEQGKTTSDSDEAATAEPSAESLETRDEDTEVVGEDGK